MRRKTAPFELGEGTDACLLVHGFLGSPWDLWPLGEALAARNLFVKVIRLPGHGRTPEALASVTHRDWEQATEEALFSLSGYRRVFVAGLSVGALLSVVLAARFPERIQGLGLMAPALRLKSPMARVVRMFGVHSLVEQWRPWLPKGGTDIDDPVERARAPVLESFPTARIRDVWALQEKVLEQLGQVRAPTFVAIAKNDRVVEPDGGRELAKALSARVSVRFIELSKGAHVMTRDLGRATLASELGTFSTGCGTDVAMVSAWERPATSSPSTRAPPEAAPWSSTPPCAFWAAPTRSSDRSSPGPAGSSTISRRSGPRRSSASAGR